MNNNTVSSYRFADPAACNIAATGELMQLGDRFRAMRLELADICSMIAKSPTVDFELEECEDLIRSQLYDLSWQIADLRAETMAGLKLKAWIISSGGTTNHGDIVAALAQSISRDIHSFPD